MGKVVEKKKKKKGRPSLLDLQKRSLRQQQEQQQQQQQKRNPNSNPYSNHVRNPIVPNPNPNPNPNRRFTRRNPCPDGTAVSSERNEGGDADVDEDDDDEPNGRRREKKLKFVLRLPAHQQQHNSSLNSGSYGSDSNAEDDNGETPHKRRKINAVFDGSGHSDAEKGAKSNFSSKGTGSLPGTQLETGPTTPLPDKKLLVFILDRLQKKDTYGVFSEPVDPEELPDYHEVIEHPMDFGTVRKKLDGGAYSNLEQFEKDVFLICSNAMTYNASDTIYFRQARSIQELAKKNFENLRQDSDDNEPEPKIVRRGRPPTKNLKKPQGRLSLERAGSEFSGATLASGGDGAMWSHSYDIKRGPPLDGSGPTDTSARAIQGSGSGEAYTSWLADHKTERNDEFSGLKGMSMKCGKKQFILDENRRNTYLQSHILVGGREPSVFTTFDGEKKLLMAVGLHSEHGYTRSLARFAANLGPIAWRVASKKISRTLPAGMKFGPGWVGENDAQPQQLQLQSTSPPGQLPSQSLPPLQVSSSMVSPRLMELKEDRPPENQEHSKNLPSNGLSSRFPANSALSSSEATNRSVVPTTEGVEAGRCLKQDSGLTLLNNGGSGAIRPRPPFQIHQGPILQPAMNGVRGGFGSNLAAQMGKVVRPARPSGSFGSETSMPSRSPPDMVSRTTNINNSGSDNNNKNNNNNNNTSNNNNNNVVHSAPVNHLQSDNTKLPVTGSSMNPSSISSSALVDSGDKTQEAATAPGSGLRPITTWRGLSLQQKPDTIPPDLNVRFQSPGSPNSSVRVESPQPDLALQL